MEFWGPMSHRSGELIHVPCQGEWQRDFPSHRAGAQLYSCRARLGPEGKLGTPSVGPCHCSQLLEALGVGPACGGAKTEGPAGPLALRSTPVSSSPVSSPFVQPVRAPGVTAATLCQRPLHSGDSHVPNPKATAGGASGMTAPAYPAGHGGFRAGPPGLHCRSGTAGLMTSLRP